jgi:hypothetical protein
VKEPMIVSNEPLSSYIKPKHTNTNDSYFLRENIESGYAQKIQAFLVSLL